MIQITTPAAKAQPQWDIRHRTEGDLDNAVEALDDLNKTLDELQTKTGNDGAINIIMAAEKAIRGLVIQEGRAIQAVADSCLR